MSTKRSTTPSDPAERSRLAHADALALREAREQEYADAVEEAETTSERLDAGDDTVTVDDMTRTQAAVLREAKLLTHATAEVARTARAVVNDDDSLAAALAHTIGAALGVPVVTRCERPTLAPDELPAALLVQRKPSETDLRLGTIAGDLELYYFRTRLHSSPDVENLTRALLRSGATVTPSASSGTTRGVPCNTVRLKVTSAAAAVPVLSGGPSRQALDAAGYLLCDAVEDHYRVMMDATAVVLRTSGAGMFGGTRPSSGFLPMRLVSVATGHPTVVADVAGSDGERQVTVTVQAQARVAADAMHRPNLHSELPDVLALMAGTFIPGLGRCRGVEGVTTSAPDKGDGLDITAHVTFVSRKPGADGPAVPQPLSGGGGRAPRRRASVDVREELDAHGERAAAHPGAAVPA